MVTGYFQLGMGPNIVLILDPVGPELEKALRGHQHKECTL